MGAMGAADFLIFLIAALVDLGVFCLLRGWHRRSEVNHRISQSLETALRSERIR